MKNCWTFVVCTLIALACIDSVRTINSTFAYHVLPTQMRHQRTSLRPATTSSALASRPVSTTSEQPDLTTETDDDAAAEPDEEEHHDSDHQLMHAKHVPSPAKVPVLPVNSGKAKTSTLTAAEYELAPSDLLNNLHSDELPVEHNEHYGHDELTPALSSQLMNSANHFLQLSRPTRLNVSTKPQFPQRKQLLIVSFDAFRYDYNRMFRRQMPHFERIAREGVWAPMGIQTAYVTKTFPTHFSIATGTSNLQSINCVEGDDNHIMSRCC